MNAPTASDSVLLSLLRKTRPDGSEFWYARDLMGLFGVTSWKRITELAYWARSRTAQLDGRAAQHVVERVVGNRIDFEMSPLAWVLVLSKWADPDPVTDHLLAHFVTRLRSSAPVDPDEDTPVSAVPDDVLTVSGYLLDHDEDSEWVRRNASVFGKRLKAVYLSARGTVPPQIEVESPEGGVWLVNQYSVQDAPLFDQVWDRFYA